MAPRSAGSRRCSQCSTPAHPASPWSTSTTASAPPPPPVASIIRKRTESRRWLALALQIIGLAAVVLAVWRGSLWSVMAALGGVAVAFGWTIRWRPGRLRRRGPPPPRPREVLDLLRQAYEAPAGWAIGLAEGTLEVLANPDIDSSLRRRGAG